MNGEISDELAPADPHDIGVIPGGNQDVDDLPDGVFNDRVALIRNDLQGDIGFGPGGIDDLGTCVGAVLGRQCTIRQHLEGWVGRR